MSWKLCIAFGVCAAGSDAFAAPAAKGFWVRASVVTDGAAVYEKPDFDSTVQDYVRIQTAVFVSKRPYAGLGGLGLFHKIHYGTKNGYVADTDIKMGKTGSDALNGAISDKPEKKSGKRKKSPWNDDSKDGGGKTPVFLTRFLGPALAMVNYTEMYSGHKLADNVIMYGVRMSGPGTLWLPLPLDFNLWFAGKPAYLSTFNGGAGSGFIVFGDLMLQLPAVNLDDWMVTYGFGLMYTYAKLSVPLRKAGTNTIPVLDSQELRVGVDFGLGVGARVKKVLLRADLKYYIERTQYLGFVGSAQLEF